MNKIIQKGFTLVELLIVIALIAILSVAVLSTINPIEQSNKARDSRVQNDAAEVLNAMERYYASNQKYPWIMFTGANALVAEDPVVLRSDTFGFGICKGEVGYVLDPTAQATNCDPRDVNQNELISTSELKTSFIGKDEFQPVITAPTNAGQALWVAKADGSDSIYLCYVPKALANRSDITKMRCLTQATGLVSVAVDGGGAGVCATGNVASWSIPVFDGLQAMFKCVPE